MTARRGLARAAGIAVAAAVVVTALAGCGDSPPPESVISFSRYTAPGQGRIFTMAPDGSDVRQVTFARGVQAHSALSPDGTKVVYTQVNPTGSSI